MQIAIAVQCDDLMGLGVYSAADVLLCAASMTEDPQPLDQLATGTLDNAKHQVGQIGTKNRIAVQSALILKKPVVSPGSVDNIYID